MNRLAHSPSVCLLHEGRPAVVRCPSCSQAYCRECVTEHGGRYLCAACLRRENQKEPRAPKNWAGWLRPIHLILGLLLAWSLFYLLGRMLIRIPIEWHEGTVVEQWVDDTR